MTGNFDFFTTINSVNADLTPFWEVAEAEYISNIIAEAECQLANAEDSLYNAPEWLLTPEYVKWLMAECEEAKSILHEYQYYH